MKEQLTRGTGWMFIIQVEGNPNSSFARASYASQKFKDREVAFDYFMKELKRLQIADEVSKIIRLEFKLSH